MTTSFFSVLFLAIVLPFFRTSPFLNRTWLVAMAAIVLLHTAVIASYAVYIQSIGSGMNVFSELFTNFLFAQSSIGLEEISFLLFSSLTPIKPKRLTKEEKEACLLPEVLKQILVGLILGDLHVYKQKLGINTSLVFEQGLVHKDYIYHLYELFEIYCRSSPKISNRLPDKRTGNIYTRIQFNTYSLPCFNEFYNLFYCEGKKIIPGNLSDLLTPLGLAYFAMDDGTLNKGGGFYFFTCNFSVEDNKYLSSLLNTKFNLNTTLHKHSRKGQYRIYVPQSKLNELIALIGPHMHPSMQYKINPGVSSK